MSLLSALKRRGKHAVLALLLDFSHVVCNIQVDIYHRAEIWREHSYAQVDATGSDFSAMLWSSCLASAASVAALLAICTCCSLTASGRLEETRPTGYVFRCEHSKNRKAKEENMRFQGIYCL